MCGLVIETSFKKGSLSIFKGENETGLWTGDDAVSRSEDLLPAIQKLLDENGLIPKDLDFTAVSRGPGSFTGMRVGIAVGKGFALGAGCQIVGVSILEAMAFEAGRQNLGGGQPVLSVVPAVGREHVYWQDYGFSGEVLEALTEIKTAPVQDLGTEFVKFESPKVVFEKTLAGVLESVLPTRDFYCLEKNMSRYVGLRALELMDRRISNSVTPLYVREL